jgi:hypothetical protein
MDPSSQITSGLCCLPPLLTLIMEQPLPWALRWNGLCNVQCGGASSLWHYDHWCEVIGVHRCTVFVIELKCDAVQFAKLWNAYVSIFSFFFFWKLGFFCLYSKEWNCEHCGTYNALDYGVWILVSRVSWDLQYYFFFFELWSYEH